MWSGKGLCRNNTTVTKTAAMMHRSLLEVGLMGRKAILLVLCIRKGQAEHRKLAKESLENSQQAE